MLPQPALVRSLIVIIFFGSILAACGGGEDGTLGAAVVETTATVVAPALSSATPPPSATPLPVAPSATPELATPTPTPEPVLPPAPIAPMTAFAWFEAPPSRDSAGNEVVYSADQTIDGRMDTAWRVPGDGQFASVTLTFSQAVQLSALGIVPGYAKVDPLSGEDRFLQNRRVSRVRLDFTGGISVEATLADRPELQTIEFDPVVTSHVTVVVLETTAPGAQDGRDFTPISELVPVGSFCPPQQCEPHGDTINELLAQFGGPEMGMQVQGIAGDYVRLRVLPTDRILDPPTMFVRREAVGRWEVLGVGTGFDPESLELMGVPSELGDW
ncbi:NADase-type glycan-binding domain-containing protein [Candidatus Viridilinea mediisalina]|uniref:NAD glycohydrolase translocation F5/8 type C domain-containing protein n=1 Tax=Candidatus Viridilinea mediisalina TaxID=2024553 RepID=A0A2A6RK80_9CHLR|nr:hypothetical protein [Candidatus Viridilinea mediisalina]PDW03289.1 hypothetical protein CJ255_09590 [Candidatus Viridilinea mediisalina]